MSEEARVDAGFYRDHVQMLKRQLAAKAAELAELRRDRERCYKEAETTVSKILHGALSGTEPRYRTEDGYLRWGLVEKEINAAIRHSQTENGEGEDSQ